MHQYTRATRNFIKIFFLVIFAGCSFEDGQQFLTDGSRAENSGAFHQAIKSYIRVLSSKDSKAQELALYKLGFIYEVHLKDPKKALLYYGELLKKSQSPETRLDAKKRIALIHMEAMQDYPKAIEGWLSLLSHFPQSVEKDFFQYQLGRAYLLSRQWEQGRVELQKLIRQFPQTKYRITAELELARSYYLENNYTDAIKELRSFLQRNPGEVQAGDARFYLAHAYEEMDDLKAAVAEFKDLLHSHPERELIQMKLDRLERRIAARKR